MRCSLAVLCVVLFACSRAADEPLHRGIVRVDAAALAANARAEQTDGSAPPPRPSPAVRSPDDDLTLRAKRCDSCCDRDEQGRCRAACTLNGPDVPVATPHGDRPLRRLRLGDEVWSYDGRKVVAVRIIALEREAAPPVDFMRVTLRNGESFLTLPQHPLPDGGCIAEFSDLLSAGINLPMPYFGIADIRPAGPAEGRVFEILPDGDTGIYWAGGVPMASAIRPPPLSMEVDVVPVPVN